MPSSLRVVTAHQADWWFDGQFEGQNEKWMGINSAERDAPKEQFKFCLIEVKVI